MPLGGMISILVMAPNLLFLFFPPVDANGAAPLAKDKTFRVMEVLEWVGRIGCLVLPFFYAVSLSDIGSMLAAAVMLFAWVAYLAGWIRYLREGRRTVLIYQSMWGLSLPMAVWPMIYFWAAAVLLGSIWLMLAVLLLTIGHIYVSNAEYRRCK